MHESGDGPAGSRFCGRTGPGSAEADRRQIEDREHIAAEINDVVVRRLYSAGLALQSALGLLDGHQAGERIQDATAELDQAIIDLRNIVFGTRRSDRPHGGARG